MSDSEDSIEVRPSRAVGFDALDSDSGSDSDSVVSVEPVQTKKAPVQPTVASGNKKKGKKNQKGKKSNQRQDDEDDWETLLEQEAEANGAKDDNETKSAKKNTTDLAADGVDPENAAAAYLSQMGIGEGADGAAAANKKKKKKGKKKGVAKAEPTAATESSADTKSKPLSAAAKMAKERQQKLKEQEEARRKDAEERKKKEEEERRRLEEEERLIQEAKERKKAAKLEKISRQKKEGTYMSRSQRAKASAAQERLAAMRAAGMRIPGSEQAHGSAASASSRPQKAPTMKQRQEQREREERERLEKEIQRKKAQEEEERSKAKLGVDAPVVDSWEDLLGSDDEDNIVTAPAANALQSVAAAGAWDDSDGEDVDAQNSIHGALAMAVKGLAGGAVNATPKQTDRRTLPLEERIELSRDMRKERYDLARQNRSADKLRSPICCVMGHVDTGKTKLLDKIRRTNVQEGEAGGITQQIGATWFPMDRLRKSTDKLNDGVQMEYKVPGLLVIDTPGHESFTNLRSRGSSLCDIAILVVDIMHGLEPQTLESLNLLRRGKTPFIVALNKVDRCYGWKTCANEPFRKALEIQPEYTQEEFQRRTQDILNEFAKEGLTAKLYYENDNLKKNLSVVPTSAMTGEGVPDLLMLLIKLTQTLMGKKMMYMDYPMGTILEVKTVEGLGTTVDVVLVNGAINEGDTIVVCGFSGPIVTQVRALLTPPPFREIRVKSDYIHHRRVEGAMGVKIAAHDLEKAVAGTPLMILHKDDEVEDLKEQVMEDLESILENMHKEPVGVFVQASTLGSLEALLEYLRSVDPPVPVAGVNLGPIHKKHITEASVMLERKPEYSLILAFDVKVTPEARQYADEVGVQIFTADIIYHLTSQFDAHLKAVREQKLAAAANLAVFPAIGKVIKVFNIKNPLVLGVEVTGGKLRLGTPMCAITGETIDGLPLVLELGKVTSIEHEHKSQDVAEAGGPPVAVKIEAVKDEQRSIQIGRQIPEDVTIYSRITRDTIDCLKENYRQDVSKPEWQCIIALKKVFKIS